MKSLLLIALMTMLTLTAYTQTTTQTIATPITITSTNKSGVITKTSKIELSKITTKRISNPSAPIVTKSGDFTTTIRTNPDNTIITTIQNRRTGECTTSVSTKNQIENKIEVLPPVNVVGPNGQIGVRMGVSSRTSVKSTTSVTHSHKSNR